jgi:glyoxylase-like metal-dependent hydrolase (beta-lactamase superfamily II)
VVAKQEQEPPEDTVREVTPGILRLQLPVDMPGLGHVNAYAIPDERGVAVVDPGIPGDASWTALLARLAAADLKVRHVHTVVVTHSHPDHFGGAHRLAAEAQAPIVTHGAWRTRLWPEGTGNGHGHRCVGVPDVDPDDVPDTNPWEAPLPWGGESLAATWRERLATAGPEDRPGDWLAPDPDRAVADGEVVALGGREWICRYTPGHTLDHLCLHDPGTGVLLSGDHVLPTITPHIGGVGSGRDPLASFMASLDRVAAQAGGAMVLPAHGHPFADLTGRVEAIKDHHHRRLARLGELSAALGPATVVDLSHELFTAVHWGPMAESETYAHLEHLRLAGAAERYWHQGRLVYVLDAARIPSGGG